MSPETPEMQPAQKTSPKKNLRAETVSARTVKKAGVDDADDRQHLDDISGRIDAEKESKKKFLDQFPEGKNLVGGGIIDFTLDQGDHKGAHTVQFTEKGIVLDKANYAFIAVGAGAFGADVTLSLYEVTRTGSGVLFRAGAYFKEGKVEASGDKTREILEKLLSGETHEQKTKDGKTIRIKKD